MCHLTVSMSGVWVNMVAGSIPVRGSGYPKAWFLYGRNGRKNRVTIFLNGQFIIVYTCKPHAYKS